MADIKPLKGYFYNQDKIKNLSEVIAPPYDVIAPEKREEYSSKEYNILHLTLPKEVGNRDKYTHSASLLNEWIKNRILVRDDRPSFYLYNHNFSVNNENLLRKGFFALVRLEDFKEGEILPHEDTLSSPKKDRFKLLKATGSNLSPIFLIYSDRESKIMNLLEKNREPSRFAGFNDLNKEKHTLWRVSNPEVHSEIKEIMQHKTLYIADGHHRYETALRFWKETGKNSHGWILAYLSPMADESLKIFSAHRLLKGFGASDWKKLNEKAGDFFWIKELPLNNIDEAFKLIEKEGERRHAFGVLYNDGNVTKTLLLVSKSEKKLLEKMDGHSPAWKHLDVSVLHSLIFSHILGFEEEKLQAASRLSYEVDRYKTIELVKDSTFQIAFLLNPTQVEEVRLVANRREKMPGKATYFYPKVPSGLIIHMLGDE
jgi:uncharacterized protein (DUF1015 family)